MRDFYEKTTKAFDVEIRVNNLEPDITADAVSAIFKTNKSDLDVNAVITANADVTTSGDTGIAEFTLTVAQTTVTPALLYYEIRWTTGTDVYILESSSVTVLDRIYD